LADSSVGRICTLADVKDRLGKFDTESDSILNRIILGIEAIFDAATGRRLILNGTDETTCFTGDCRRIIVPRYPVVSITSIKESVTYDFGNADALVADESYRLIAARGVLYRIGTYWLAIEDGIQVIYKGGYVAAGQTPGSGETAMPADLREAAIEQATFIFKRKDDIGLIGAGFDGGSINKFSVMKLLPMVQTVLDKYRRPSL